MTKYSVKNSFTQKFYETKKFTKRNFNEKIKKNYLKHKKKTFLNKKKLFELQSW